MAAEPVPVVERHATWKELFFDLVVVAGIGQLAHLLHEDTEPTTLGLYAVLYLAFWISWAGFAVYGNVAGDDAKTSVLIAAMLGLAVMAASVPGIHGSRAAAFVVAYVALRWYAGAVVQRGRVLLDWPLAQYGLGALPWLVSLWVDAPLRYWLWGVGIVIDLVLLLVTSGERALQEAEERLERVKTSRRRGGPRAGLLSIEGARTEEEHLSERLGLFVIIVLGEGLIQVIDAAADSAQWDRATVVVALGAFALLASVWAAGLLHGTAGIPQLHAARGRAADRHAPARPAHRCAGRPGRRARGGRRAHARAPPAAVPGAAVRGGGRLLRARRGDRAPRRQGSPVDPGPWRAERRHPRRPAVRRGPHLHVGAAGVAARRRRRVAGAGEARETRPGRQLTRARRRSDARNRSTDAVQTSATPAKNTDTAMSVPGKRSWSIASQYFSGVTPGASSMK